MKGRRPEPIVAHTCDDCGHTFLPEDVTLNAMESPSGDMVTGVHCDCGKDYLLSWHKSKWAAMHAARKKQLRDQYAADKQKKQSAIGREVAEFRRELERIETVADFGWGDEVHSDA